MTIENNDVDVIKQTEVLQSAENFLSDCKKLGLEISEYTIRRSVGNKISLIKIQIKNTKIDRTV